MNWGEGKMTIGKISKLFVLAFSLLIPVSLAFGAGQSMLQAEKSKPASVEQLVAETHAASLKLREETCAKPSPRTRPGLKVSGERTFGASRLSA